MTRLSWTSALAATTLTNICGALSTATPRNHSIPQPSSWNLLTTQSTARLRGLAPVSDQISWASGTQGTVLRTTDGGRTWTSVGPTSDNDIASLEFRDIEAWTADRAVILSIGEGNSSRVYLTSDGGASWTRSFTNEEAGAFYDCVAFEDGNPLHGMAMSDPVGGKIRLLETRDGGVSWDVVDPEGMVPALDGEAGFAASGTCLATTAGRWYVAAGGVDPGRVFRSGDGYHWDVSGAAIAGGEGSGVFSVQFRDATRGIAVGGNYSDPDGNVDNAAWTVDGGVTWVKAATFPDGYRSGSAWVPGCGYRDTALAVGPSGSDFTLDGGKSWSRFDNGSFDSVECVKGPVCWASGENGRVARLVLA